MLSNSYAIQIFYKNDLQHINYVPENSNKKAGKLIIGLPKVGRLLYAKY